MSPDKLQGKFIFTSLQLREIIISRNKRDVKIEKYHNQNSCRKLKYPEFKHVIIFSITH